MLRSKDILIVESSKSLRNERWKNGMELLIISLTME